MLYGGVICYNETGLCQHFSLVLTFSGCELESCIIPGPSPRSSPRPPGQPAPLSQKTWTEWEKERRAEWWKAAGGGEQQRRWRTKCCESDLGREAGRRGRCESINSRYQDEIHKLKPSLFLIRWVLRRSVKPCKSSICSSGSSALDHLSVLECWRKLQKPQQHKSDVALGPHSLCVSFN